MNEREMNAEVLQTRLINHNRRAVLFAIGLAICAVVFWFVSYAIASLLTATFFRLWKLSDLAPWIQPAIVAGFMLLLVGEMWRSRDGLFNLSELHDSDFYLGPGSRGTMAMGMDHPVTQSVVGTYAAWIVSQTVLLAPHTTSTAFRHWRSRVKVDESTVQRAVELYRTLSEKKDWVPVTDRKQQQELAYLDRTGLLWSRLEGKLLEVQTFRYEPTVSKWREYFTLERSEE